MEGSTINTDRGKLFFDENGVGVYRFVKGEPHTCGNCHNDLVSSVYACEFCKNVYCYDCIKYYKACLCYQDDQEHIFHKVSVGGDL